MSLRRRLEMLERVAVLRCAGHHIVLAGGTVAGCDCGLVLVAEGRLLRSPTSVPVLTLGDDPLPSLCL